MRLTMDDQRPKGYPKASDLVNKLIEDVQIVLGPLPDDDMRRLKDNLHVSVRLHRHEQERFGKKWKQGRSGPKAGGPQPSKFWSR